MVIGQLQIEWSDESSRFLKPNHLEFGIYRLELGQIAAVFLFESKVRRNLNRYKESLKMCDVDNYSKFFN